MKVRRSSELPLPAHRARELAALPEVMQFVMAPVLTFSMEQAPSPGERVSVGFRARGRVRWLGVIPSWTHEIEVVHVGELTVATHERGGPVRTWNHRLQFEPISPVRCVYTDEIDVGEGLQSWVTAAFALLMFAHRHRRWRLLARLLADDRDRNGTITHDAPPQHP